jgi:hypothetical protein
MTHTATTRLVKSLSVLESNNGRRQSNFLGFKMAQNTYIHTRLSSKILIIPKNIHYFPHFIRNLRSHLLRARTSLGLLNMGILDVSTETIWESHNGHLHYRLNFDLDKNFITAWKSITKIVIFQSFVAKCCKVRII